MLLTKRKVSLSRLLSVAKARSGSATPSEAPALDHDLQLAVVDAVEWAVERWASREHAASASDPRLAHATRLIAALIYLDARFEQLDPSFVTELVDGVVNPPSTNQPGPRLDAKAAAALLAVEVGAFRR